MSERDRLVRVKMDDAVYSRMLRLMVQYDLKESEVVSIAVTSLANTHKLNYILHSYIKGKNKRSTEKNGYDDDINEKRLKEYPMWGRD